tara:strand:- start:819 stop:1127 length:309 start_codon:yes stop_codon:yes gene_type:complete
LGVVGSLECSHLIGEGFKVATGRVVHSDDTSTGHTDKAGAVVQPPKAYPLAAPWVAGDLSLIREPVEVGVVHKGRDLKESVLLSHDGLRCCLVVDCEYSITD